MAGRVRMLLAEALARRSDIQVRMASLLGRMKDNAQVQEGEAPAEDVVALIREYEAAAAELEGLIRAINRTNSVTPVPGDDRSMTDALAARDVLKQRMAMYRSVAAAATPSTARYSRTEIRQVPQVRVADMQREADRLAAEHRELDNRIQQANWATTLVEDSAPA